MAAGIVDKTHIHQTENRQLHLGGEQAQAVEAEHKAKGQGNLQDHLLGFGKAEVAVLDDLDKVIKEADQPRAKRQKQHHHASLHLGQAQNFRQLVVEHPPHQAQRDQDAEDEAQAAHGGGAVFLVVPGGAFLADGLAEVQPMQRRDHKLA